MRAKESGNHGSLPLARGRADRFERLQFRFEVETVAGFGLDGRRSVTGQIRQHREDFLRQRGFAGLPHAVNAGANSSASFGDLFVVRARNPLLKIHQPRMREHRMGVGIDEAGKHHASATVDLDNLLAILLQPRIAKSVFCGANRDDLSGEAEHGSVLNDAEIGKGSAASRAVCR